MRPKIFDRRANILLVKFENCKARVLQVPLTVYAVRRNTVTSCCTSPFSPCLHLPHAVDPLRLFPTSASISTSRNLWRIQKQTSIKSCNCSQIQHLPTFSRLPSKSECVAGDPFTRDASFRHPMCSVEPAANSREGILGLYQCVPINRVRVRRALTKRYEDGIVS